MPIAIYPNDSTYARIIAVMSEVRFNVFRVVLILDNLTGNHEYANDTVINFTYENENRIQDICEGGVPYLAIYFNFHKLMLYPHYLNTPQSGFLSETDMKRGVSEF